jgi:hypothetical protein
MTLAEMRTLYIETGSQLYFRELAALEWRCMRELFARGEWLEERPEPSEPWTGYRCASEGRNDYGRQGRRRLLRKL